MYYLMEELANQREREITARTRAGLFPAGPAPGRTRPAPPEPRRRRSMLPALSWTKRRHWAARPDQVYCSRAASVSGAC